MDDEILKVTKLVEEKKISPEDAYKLIEAIYTSRERASAAGTGRTLRIQILDTGGNNVNINLPLRLIRWATKLIPASERKKLEQKGFAVDDIVTLIDNGATGEIVNISEAGGNSVHVWLE